MREIRQKFGGLARVLAGSVLLAAAGLKAYDLSYFPLERREVVLLLQVGAEWALGMAMLAGAAPFFWRALAIICFTAFAGVSLYKLSRGEADCGCFGPVPVRPAYTLGLDLLIVVLLGFWRPAGERFRRQRLRWTAAALLGLAPALAAIGLLATRDADHMPVDPAAWMGKPLPLMRHIDIHEQISTGRWTLIFYQHDCPECKPYLLKMHFDPSHSHVAVIEIPPYGRGGMEKMLQARGAVLGRLGEERYWFIETPLKIVVDGGVVREIERPAGED